MVLSTFAHIRWHLYVVFRDLSVWYFAYSETELFWGILVLNCKSNLCILYTNLLQCMFATIFSHSIYCLFLYWFLCYAIKMLAWCSLICLFLLLFPWLLVEYPNSLPAPSSGVFPNIFFWNFYDFSLCLSFQSILSWFLRMEWDMNPISFFHMWISSFQNTLIQETILLPCFTLVTLLKISSPYICRFNSALFILFSWSVCRVF